MLIATTRNELLSILKSDDYKEKEIGFVPTMGALHQGHISLIEKAVKDNERVVASIFVNPSQFNDPSDLKNYPRTPDDDLKLLRESGCDLVFHPSPAEVYDETEPVVPDPG